MTSYQIQQQTDPGTCVVGGPSAARPPREPPACVARAPAPLLTSLLAPVHPWEAMGDQSSAAVAAPGLLVGGQGGLALRGGNRFPSGKINPASSTVLPLHTQTSPMGTCAIGTSICGALHFSCCGRGFFVWGRSSWRRETVAADALSTPLALSISDLCLFNRTPHGKSSPITIAMNCVFVVSKC